MEYGLMSSCLIQESHKSACTFKISFGAEAIAHLHLPEKLDICKKHVDFRSLEPWLIRTPRSKVSYRVDPPSAMLTLSLDPWLLVPGLMGSVCEKR